MVQLERYANKQVAHFSDSISIVNVYELGKLIDLKRDAIESTHLATRAFLGKLAMYAHPIIIKCYAFPCVRVL